MIRATMALVALGWAFLQDDAKVDDRGFVCDWLVLLPIPCENENSGADEIDAKPIKDEAAIRPKEGEKTVVRGKELTWKKIRTRKNFIDFRELVPEAEGEDAVAYAVAYVVADEDLKDLQMKIGSNDQSKVYLTGKEVFKFTETRVLEEDSDTVKGVSLNKGRNTLVFKVVNEKNNWQACLRFTDRDGAPAKSLAVTLKPE
jgi:hypothetical protein